MKNKKMWAIAILVAFMMTLIPMAAFAADRHASLMIVNKTAVEADGESKVKFTVYVRESNNSNAAGETIYVASERGTTDRFFEMGSKNAKPRASYYAFTDADKDGKIEFQLASSVAGKAQVAVGLKNNVYTYLSDSRVTASAAEIIGAETITFEATEASVSMAI